MTKLNASWALAVTSLAIDGIRLGRQLVAVPGVIESMIDCELTANSV